MMQSITRFDQTVLAVCADLTTALSTQHVVVVGRRGSGRSTLCERVSQNPQIRRLYGDAVVHTNGLDWWGNSVTSDALRRRINDVPALVIIDDLDTALRPNGSGDEVLEFCTKALRGTNRVSLLVTLCPDSEVSTIRAVGPRLRRSKRHPLLQPSVEELAAILEQQCLLLEMCHLPYDRSLLALAAEPAHAEFGLAHPRLGIDRLDRWGAHAKAIGLEQVTEESATAVEQQRLEAELEDDRERSGQNSSPGQMHAVLQNFDRSAFVARLSERVIGQQDAVERVADLLDMSFRGLRLRSSEHLGAILMVGRSGVGKSSLAKAVCEALDGTLLNLDGTEFADDASRNCLLGAPPAYVGHDDHESIPARVNRAIESSAGSGPLVFLVDEIEKAHRDVQLLFLQALEGRLTDSHGVTANFSNTVFMMSSNLTASRRAAGFTASSEPERQTIETLKKDLPPEFIGRFDLIIEFEPLSQQALRTIVDRELDSINDSLRANGYSFDVAPEVIDLIIERGTDPALGARLLHRSIERHLLAPLARQKPGHYEISLTPDRRVALVSVAIEEGGSN